MSCASRCQYLEHANARAVVDGRELVQPLACAGDALEKSHVHLQAVTGLRLLVPLPPFRIGPMLLALRQTVHAVPAKDAMHRRDRQRELVLTP
jgi:hypothetical protein